MSELRKRFCGLNINKISSRNIFPRLMKSQIDGRGLRSTMIPNAYLQELEQRFNVRKVPTIIEELRNCLSERKFDSAVVLAALKELHSLQSSDNVLARGTEERQDGKGLPCIPGYCRTSSLIHLFGGVKVIFWILFSPEIRPSKDLNNLYVTPRHSSASQLEIRSSCLEILHDLFLNVDTVASSISKMDEVIEYLFLMMEDKKTFSCASVVLEDLLASNRKIVDLSTIVNLHNLIISLRDNNFASFCRILSVVVADIDFSEDRNTLLAQNKELKVRATEKAIADSNQVLLLSFPEFLTRMVKLAGKSLPGAIPSQSSRSTFENMIWNGAPINVVSLLDELASMNNQQDWNCLCHKQRRGWPMLDKIYKFGKKESKKRDITVEAEDSINHNDLESIIPRRLRFIYEVMYKVEILYVLTLFLNGKCKAEVQLKIGDLKLIPALCDSFDRLGWNNSSQRFPTHNHSEAEDCDCTPESALKIQFLRFVHSFCDHSETKHLLLSTRELEEMQKICDQLQCQKPPGLESSKSRLRCRGEKGLLTKIVDILKRTTPNNALRFWLSRAIEGFLRGRVSPPDQRFLINRDMIEHLLEHIVNPDTKSKEILQSSFDLLGELMKFNEYAFQRFNAYVITDLQFEKFVSTMMSNVVDSNMFIRCIILSLERFSSESQSQQNTSCRLRNLIRKWEHKIYLMYRLITSISVDNLTQENVSCLNTTLIFLMFAHNHGHLGQYLQAFVSEEQAQQHPGLILANLRDLLEFWKVHYLQRVKDRTQLEQSSCIGFEHWQKLVDVLLNNDTSHVTSILHHLSPWQQQAPTRIRTELMQRDA